jgi:hypothetical protein
VHDADDPKDFGIILAVVAEDDGEDDASEVTGRAREAGDDAFLKRKRKESERGHGR